MKLTRITSDSGILTKRIFMRDGKVQKEPVCNMTHGRAERLTVPSFEKLLSLTGDLLPNEAIVHCPFRHELDRVKVVTARKLNGEKNAISRTNDFFEYMSGDSVTISFDYDDPTKIEPDELREMLASVWPNFNGAGFVFLDSSSGGLSHPDGTAVTGSTGMRYLFAVKDAADIPRFSEALAAKCWLAGHGRIFISVDGKMHHRTIFDTAVHSPERLDFLAAPKLDDGITQDRRAYFEEGHLLDTQTLASLNEDERIEVARLKKETEHLVEAEAKRIRKHYRERRIEKLRADGHDPRTAKKIVDARLAGKVLSRDVLTFDDLGDVPAIDVLKNPPKFHLQTLADPVEPETGTNRAVIYWNDEQGEIRLHSNLHGGQDFLVLFDFDSLCAYFDKLPDDETFFFHELTRRADLSASEQERFNLKVKARTKLQLPTIRAQQMEERTALSHQEIAEKYIEKFSTLKYSDGELWTPSGENLWSRVDKAASSMQIGKQFKAQVRCQTGSAYSQVLQQVQNNCSDETFFMDAPKGFATPSGFVYIEDGEVKEADLTMAHRQRFAMPFDMIDEPPSMLLEFLETCFKGCSPKSQILRVQELFGVVLLGIGCDYEKAFFLHGPGNSGKSTLIRVLEYLIPSEFRCAVPPLYFNDPYYTALMAGKLLCTIAEGDFMTLSAAFKSMTGRDSVIARNPTEKPFSFHPSALLIVNANDLPALKSADGAMMRRLELLTFPNSRIGLEGTNVTDLDRRIFDTDQGRILSFALEGARRVIDKNGYTKNKANDSLMKKWMRQNDNVRAWLDDKDRIKIGRKEWAARSSIWADYRAWCADEEIKPDNKQRFYQRVESSGFVPSKRHTKGFLGLGLINDGSNAPEPKTDDDDDTPY